MGIGSRIFDQILSIALAGALSAVLRACQLWIAAMLARRVCRRLDGNGPSRSRLACSPMAGSHRPPTVAGCSGRTCGPPGGWVCAGRPPGSGRSPTRPGLSHRLVALCPVGENEPARSDRRRCGWSS